MRGSMWTVYTDNDVNNELMVIVDKEGNNTENNFSARFFVHKLTGEGVAMRHLRANFIANTWITTHGVRKRECTHPQFNVIHLLKGGD